MNIFLFTLAAYLLGAVPTSLVLAKILAKEDIRGAGSGNIGATNAVRIHGKKFGAMTFVGDMLKGFVPVWVGTLLFREAQFVALFGLAAFLGHLFPVYLKFRGGKGVATAFGIFLYLAPAVLLIEVVVFVLIAFLWRYVSLASLAVAAVMPFLLAAYACPAPVIVLSIVMCALIFIKHSTNIKRLLNGTESRIGKS